MKRLRIIVLVIMVYAVVVWSDVSSIQQGLYPNA